MIVSPLSFDQIEQLTGGRTGRFDVPCPACGPLARARANQMRPVLAIWRPEPGFATFNCSRCELRGYARDADALVVPRRISEADLAAARRAEAQAIRKRIGKAAWLFGKGLPPAGSVVETYLRKIRGYDGELPDCLGFLPARSNRPAAMIAAMTDAAGNIAAVHLTKLAPDGRKVGTPAKIIVGAARCAPIRLQPVNDGLGLLIAEGIEDALSGFEALGCGAWAAGAASFLPHLASVIPPYIEVATLIVDDDRAGRHNCTILAKHLSARGVEVRLFRPSRSAA